jgi:hypothetical protein
MPVWIKSGKLVVGASGKPKVCGACPCVDDGCPCSGERADIIRVVLTASDGGGSCGFCNFLQGTYDLAWTNDSGFPCGGYWLYSDLGGPGHRLQLLSYFDTSGNWLMLMQSYESEASRLAGLCTPSTSGVNAQFLAGAFGWTVGTYDCCGHITYGASYGRAYPTYADPGDPIFLCSVTLETFTPIGGGCA